MKRFFKVIKQIKNNLKWVDNLTGNLGICKSKMKWKQEF